DEERDQSGADDAGSACEEDSGHDSCLLSVITVRGDDLTLRKKRHASMVHSYARNADQFAGAVRFPRWARPSLGGPGTGSASQSHRCLARCRTLRTAPPRHAASRLSSPRR
ncbi:hypothetical protein AB4Z22_44835, partial [Paenibacillus sp. TAF58]